jgi:DNA-directed RNA polymerase specialized sigma24 family protein
MKKKEKKLLRRNLEECEKHRMRMNYAYHKLSPLIPLSNESVKNLTDEEISKLDQYIFRFSKLQDALGKKLFKSVLQFLGEDVYSEPFLDIFHRLEQLGAIQNYENWDTLRIMRNDIAHEYDENPYELAEKLNSILNSKENLENYLNDIRNYLNKRGWKSEN